MKERLLGGDLSIQAKDGAVYRVRAIRPDDAPSLIRGYDALSERGKWFRMLHAVPHLTEEMAAQFCAPDPSREICAVVEGRGDLAGEILGGARIADFGPGRAAEFSVSLRPEARGLGLARQVLAMVLEIAWESGAASVWGAIAGRNAAMLGLAQRLGFDLERDVDDLSIVNAVLSAPPLKRAAAATSRDSWSKN